MSAKPYTDEELADITRQFNEWAQPNMDEAVTQRRLATLDARDAELAALRLRYREALALLKECYDDAHRGRDRDAAGKLLADAPAIFDAAEAALARALEGENAK